MESELHLSDLAPGESATIRRILGTSPFKKRLLEMGFTQGEAVVKEKTAPLADPSEYVIKGYHLSLRRDEADAIIIEQPSEQP